MKKLPDSPTNNVCLVCCITFRATPMAFFMRLRSATAPTSIVLLDKQTNQTQMEYNACCIWGTENRWIKKYCLLSKCHLQSYWFTSDLLQSKWVLFCTYRLQSWEVYVTVFCYHFKNVWRVSIALKLNLSSRCPCSRWEPEIKITFFFPR